MYHPLFQEAPLKEEVPCPTFQRKVKLKFVVVRRISSCREQERRLESWGCFGAQRYQVARLQRP